MDTVATRDTARTGEARTGAPPIELLIERYGALVKARLRRFLRDATDREDAEQSVWLAIHCGLPKFRGDADVGTWIYAVTHNVAASMHRKRSFWGTLTTEICAVVANPEDAAAASERLRRVLVLARTLPEAERRAFAVKLLNIGEPCKPSLHRARKRLASLV